MPSDKDFDAAKATEPLYGWWLKLIPSLLGGAPPAAAEESSSLPFPIGQVSQALDMTRQLLGPLYQSYFRALLAHPQPEQAFGVFQELIQAQLQRNADALAGIGSTLSAQPGLPAAGWGLLTEPMSVLGDAMKPLALNLERAYGGLADAFGLAPSRAVHEAGREMAAAALAKRQAQAEYLGLVFSALAKGSEAMLAQLAEMGRRGESVDTLLGLVRLWARTADEALHRDLQSPKALQASANVLRAATRTRAQQQRLVAIASEALNVPTRAEVDEAYREIQELKRELRSLRKLIAPVIIVPAAAAVPATPRARAPAAKRSTTKKVKAS